MVTVLVSALALTTGPSDSGFPNLVDRELVDYFERAVDAGKSGQRNKALAMLQLLLLPEETTIEVDYTGVPSSSQTAFERGVGRGLGLWQEAMQQDMPLRIVRPGRKADILVKFVDKVAEGDARCKGEIRAKRWIQWNDQVHYQQFTAVVSVCKHADSRLMSESEITHIVAHELGHALGLGDMASTGYIMGPVELGNPFARLNTVEVDAVKQFRSKVRDEMSRISSGTLIRG